MKPSPTSPPVTLPENNKRVHDHAPTDWQARKSAAKYPFDIVVLTQTPIESEFDLMFDHGAEPAAKFHGDARIYRLKDDRFAVMALSPGAINNPPDGIEFWNWWARTPQPSFADLTTSKEIANKIAQIEFMRQSGKPATVFNA